ncbi:MAG TPA: TIM-barrel domain-containing protein [Candidatus Methylacidiphilales bacterium]|nr:TIM-barrel domain-containing protein [Candidatus Methylacidiphilales bacterium]
MAFSADAPGTAVTNHARFTVITPNLIRMEYAPDGKFINSPSWFAVNRTARYAQARITNNNGKVDIDTGAIHLTYQDDGTPFSPDNLQAEIKKGNDTVPWKPGMTSTQNLGGTIRTLDQIFGAVPLDDGILSRDGWYLLDDSQSPLFVGDWIQERPKNGAFDWYLFGYGLDYPAAFHSFTAVGGPVPMPRKYTLGIWYSRFWPYSADEFKQIVQEYTDHDFPLDMIVMDMDWHLSKSNIPNLDYWTGYTWDRNLIANPPSLLSWFHDQGLHVTLNDHPADGIQPHEEMYADFMRAMGKDPASGETIPFDAGDKHYLDTFFKYSHVPREKEGVDFWWLDWQQYPDTRSLPDVTNLQLLNFYNYTRSQADGLRGQSFSRWAGWGDHRYPIQFSGDADTGWPMLAFEVPFTSTGGNVGAFFWSHDIGGHHNGRNEESYTRWCQFGAFSAVLRSHSTRDATMDRRPWTYPDWAEASMRKSFHLRSEMMPYLYTSVWQGTRSSVPFLRPLYIDNPDVEQAYHNGQEYQFGDNLLVAPIAQPGVGPNRVATQAVWFPKGDWYDFFTGERFTGPTEAIAADSIDTFPLYVRGGVPLPMQAYTPRPGTAPLMDMVLRCYPGEDGKTGTSVVYEDDGVTTGYEHREFATTALSYTRQGDVITVVIAPTQGSFPGQPSTRRCVVELPCMAKADSYNFPGAKFSYDEASLTNRIELPETSVSRGVTLVVHAAEIDPALVVKRAVAQHLQDLLGQPYDTWKASNTPLPPEMDAAFSAAKGFALVEQNLHPYLLGSDTALLYCHNHQDTPEAVSVAMGNASPTQLSFQTGDPVAKAPTESGLPHALPVTVTVPDDSPSGVVLHSRMPAYHDLSDDLALKATAEASSGNAAGAIDGKIGGYPNDRSQEWTSNGEREGAWIKLSWSNPVNAQAIWLYDRPNPNDQILAGTIEFDDGTKMDVGALPNDGSLPFEVTFPAKSIHWVKFTVTKVSSTTENIGLSEMAVLGAP